MRGLVIISTTKAYPRGSGTKHSEAVCDLNEGKEKEDGTEKGLKERMN